MTPAEVFAVEIKQYAADGFAGLTIVPRVIGRTAGAMTKQSAGKAKLTPEEYRAQASEMTRELGEMLGSWARRHGYQVRETPQTRTVFRADDTVIARLYYTFDGAVDIDITSVRKQKGDAAADAALAQLQALTTKRLSKKWPSTPAEDIYRDWSGFEDLLERIR